MFTGIVQAVGQVREIGSGVLWVDAPDSFFAEGPAQIGESISVSGCCLTVTPHGGPGLRFDLSPETLARTSLGSRAAGALVNLERAMRPIDRLGGHIVQGHVDGVGSLVSVLNEGDAHVYRFRAPAGGGRYLIDKGSICLEGISLTVVEPDGDEFDTWIIPHTLEQTSLVSLTPGDAVNVEFDVLAKHVEKLLRAGI